MAAGACDRAADKCNHSQNPVAPRTGFLRNSKFRLQAYWAETRTPGAGSVPRARGGGPGFWPLSVLGLNSEPISKKKKNLLEGFPYLLETAKQNLWQRGSFFVGFPAAFSGRICFWLPWPTSQWPECLWCVCVWGGRWLGARGVNTPVRVESLDSPES